jgi:hypothetical protein
MFKKMGSWFDPTGSNKLLNFGSWWDDNVVHGGLNTSGLANEMKTWKLPASGQISAGGMNFGWGAPGEDDMLKYGFMAVGVYLVWKMANK